MRLKYNMSLKRSEVKEYNMLRAIAILLVVFGHSAYFIMTTDYGEINYSNCFYPSGKVYNFLDFIIAMIYNFHMPLFIFISGAVHHLVVKNKKYSFESFIKIKFKRLMLPYFIVGIFYMIPLKYIGGFYKEQSIYDIFVNGLLLSKNAGHLWFLFMLFMIFVIFRVFEKYMLDNNYNIIIMAILLVLNIFSDKITIEVFQVAVICKYFIWFYLGFKFEEIRKYINKIISKNSLLLFLISSAILILTTYYNKFIIIDSFIISNWILYRIFLFIIEALGIITIYIFALNMKECNVINFINKYSFDIYLFHDPLNYIILAIINSIGAFGYFSHGIRYLLFVLSRFIITLTLSILIKLCIDNIKKVKKIQY